ncbi:MAG: cadherin-like beta sandwich domain-containing protein [Saccharofermentanales bacterium]|jgi:hypothetical protein
MKKQKWPILLMMAVLLFNFACVPVRADGLSIKVLSNRSSPTTGQIITITFALNVAVDIKNYDIYVEYEPDYLEFLPKSDSTKNLVTALEFFYVNRFADNQIVAVATGSTHVSSTKLFSLAFKALKPTKDPTTTTISVTKIVINDDHDDEPARSSISFTISDPVPQSDVNTLKSLTISKGTLSPAFSPDTRNYTAVVGVDDDKILVSAATTDSKASIKGGGTVKLSEGENTIRLTVTAENGDQRTYAIVVTRPTATPSPSPSPTPAVTVPGPGGDTFSVSDLPEGVAVPAGFYSTVKEMDGRNVPAYKSLQGDLTLFYLVRDDGTAGFYYADQDGTYLPFLTISLPALNWPILNPDSSVDIPSGFIETEMTVEGQRVKAWQRQEPEGRDPEYLVYLMGGDGNRRFYLYDRNNQLLIPYQENAPVPTEPTEPSATIPETDPVSTTPTPATPAETPESAGSGAWQLMTFLFGILCLVLLGLVVWLLIRQRRMDNLSKPQRPHIRRVD